MRLLDGNRAAPGDPQTQPLPWSFPGDVRAGDGIGDGAVLAARTLLPESVAERRRRAWEQGVAESRCGRCPRVWIDPSAPTCGTGLMGAPSPDRVSAEEMAARSGHAEESGARAEESADRRGWRDGFRAPDESQLAGVSRSLPV